MVAHCSETSNGDLDATGSDRSRQGHATEQQPHHRNSGLSHSKLAEHNANVQHASDERTPLKDWQRTKDDIPVGQILALKLQGKGQSK